MIKREIGKMGLWAMAFVLFISLFLFLAVVIAPNYLMFLVDTPIFGDGAGLTELMLLPLVLALFGEMFISLVEFGRNDKGDGVSEINLSLEMIITIVVILFFDFNSGFVTVAYVLTWLFGTVGGELFRRHQE
jgi:hypothetical protein